MTRPLPWTIRVQIDDYLRTVAEAAPFIFEEADVLLVPQTLDEFLFAAGVRKLWNLVESQYVLLSSALTLVEPHGVERVQVGRRGFSRDSETYAELRELRHALYRELLRLGVFPIVDAPTLAEVAFYVAVPRRGQ
jgi:hypothetical protein